MCQDRYGLIWIVTRSNLVQLDLQGTGEPLLQFYWNVMAARKTGSGFEKVYDRVFKILSLMVSTDVFYTDRDEQLWFSKGDELFHFDAKRAKEEHESLEVLVRRVRIAGDSVLFNGTHYTFRGSEAFLGASPEVEPR